MLSENEAVSLEIFHRLIARGTKYQEIGTYLNTSFAALRNIFVSSTGFTAAATVACATNYA